MGSIKLIKNDQVHIVNLKKAKFAVKLPGQNPGIEIYFNEQAKLQFHFENEEKRNAVFKKIEELMDCHCCKDCCCSEHSCGSQGQCGACGCQAKSCACPCHEKHCACPCHERLCGSCSKGECGCQKQCCCKQKCC